MKRMEDETGKCGSGLVVHFAFFWYGLSYRGGRVNLRLLPDKPAGSPHVTEVTFFAPSFLTALGELLP